MGILIPRATDKNRWNSGGLSPLYVGREIVAGHPDFLRIPRKGKCDVKCLWMVGSHFPLQGRWKKGFFGRLA